MSSPVKGSIEGSLDDSLRSADAAFADVHEAETRRLQEDVVEAAQRLEREAAERAAESNFQLTSNNTLTFRIPVVRRAVERPNGDDPREDANERVWSALRSEFLASSSTQRGWGVPGVAMIAGSIGAVIVAAAVALLVVNLIQVPSPTISASGEDEVSRKEFSSTAVNLAKIAAAQAKMQPAEDEPQVPVSAPAPAPVMLATAGPASEIAVAKPPAREVAPPPEVMPAAPPEIKPAVVESPPSPPPASSPSPAVAAEPSPAVVAEPPPAAAAEPPPPAVNLSQDEIASLLKRGRELIGAGDIASARLVLTHLAEAGVAEASFTLAGTFDPTVLENMRIVGMRPDPAKARVWYSRAAEQGSMEAKQRLQALR
jgi:hypothetical protein